MTDPKTNRPRPDYGSALNPQPRDDCDLTVAYIAGVKDGRQSMEARIEALEAEMAPLRNGLEHVADLPHDDTCSEELTEGAEACDCHRAVARLALVYAEDARIRAALDGESG